MHAFEFYRPASLKEASDLLAKSPGKLLAGGPAWK
jgi:CO/xanthine dehydrogenase FAD-binding subunit